MNGDNGFADLFLALAQNGILGIILAWFMWRLEGILKASNKHLQILTMTILRMLEKQDRKAADELLRRLQDKDDDGL